MPTREHYRCLTLADALEAFAEHHHQGRTRHISNNEYELLVASVAALRRLQVGTTPFPEHA